MSVLLSLINGIQSVFYAGQPSDSYQRTTTQEGDWPAKVANVKAKPD